MVTFQVWKDGQDPAGASIPYAQLPATVEGGAATTGLVGEELTLSVSAAEFDEGKGVTFSIFAEGANTESEQPIMAIGADIEGGKAEAVWTYRFKHDPENPLTEKPKFIFSVSADKAETVESGSVEISATFEITIKDDMDELIEGYEYELTGPDGSSEKVEPDSEGKILAEDKIPGRYTITVKKEEK